MCRCYYARQRRRVRAPAGLWLIAATACAQMQQVPGITAAAGNGTAGYAGDSGLATSAKLSSPAGVAFDSAGNWYIADYNNCRIRKVAIATGPFDGRRQRNLRL